MPIPVHMTKSIKEKAQADCNAMILSGDQYIHEKDIHELANDAIHEYDLADLPLDDLATLRSVYVVCFLDRMENFGY